MSPAPDDVGEGRIDSEQSIQQRREILEKLDRIGLPLIGFAVDFTPLSADRITHVHPITGTSGHTEDEGEWRVLGQTDFSARFPVETIEDDDMMTNPTTGAKVDFGGKTGSKTYHFEIASIEHPHQDNPLTNRPLTDKATGRGNFVVVISSQQHGGFTNEQVLQACLGKDHTNATLLTKINQGLTATSSERKT